MIRKVGLAELPPVVPERMSDEGVVEQGLAFFFPKPCDGGRNPVVLDPFPASPLGQILII